MSARMTKKGKQVVPFSLELIFDSHANTQKKREPLRKVSERRKFNIGVADLDVFAGYLPDVLSTINNAQRTFQFQKVIIPIPSGLSISGARTNQIVKSQGQRISKVALASNVYAPDLYGAVRPVVTNLGYDALGLLVSRMIMDEVEPGKLGWNLCWSAEKRVFVASAYEVPRYAVMAQRTVEACVANLTIAAAFATIFSKVECHDETRGCVFDYCEERDDMVVGFRKMSICAESLALFPEWARADVKKVVRAIKDYKRATAHSAKKISSRTTVRRKVRGKPKVG